MRKYFNLFIFMANFTAAKVANLDKDEAPMFQSSSKKITWKKYTQTKSQYSLN